MTVKEKTKYYSYYPQLYLCTPKMTIKAVRGVFNIKVMCLTRDFERHTEVNLDDWNVLHSRSFLVHL